MKNIFRALLIGLILSLLLIALFYFNSDSPEWFKHAGEIFAFFVRLAEAYVASFIFFVLVEYIPYWNGKRSTVTGLYIILYRILYSAGQLINYLLVGTGLKISYEEPIEIDISKINDDLQLNFSQERVGSLYLGSNFMLLQGFSPEQACQMIIESIKTNIVRVEDKFEYLDENLVDILLFLRNSDLVESVSKSPNAVIFEQVLKTRVKEIKTFIRIYYELVNYMKLNKYPLTSQAVIEFREKRSKKK